MNNVKLMNRTDTKFTFGARQLALILKEAAPFYKCLEIEGRKSSRYETLYYDTENFSLYHKHHNGELNRYKIRHRTYVESGQSYLEVKFKTNKGRTIKTRIMEKHPQPVFSQKAQEFLMASLPFSSAIIRPVVFVNYTRITLVNKLSAERITIDLNLEFKKQEHALTLSNLVIAEVKQERKTASPFLHIMRKHRVREGSVSKYCMAVAFMYHGVKKNNFKEKILSLKHILSHDTIAGIYRHAG